MAQTIEELTAKVARLECDLRDLRDQLKLPSKKPWWQEIAGSAKDDPTHEAMMREVRRMKKADKARVIAEIEAEEAAERKHAAKNGRQKGLRPRRKEFAD